MNLNSKFFPDLIKTFSSAGFGICIVDTKFNIKWANDVLTFWYGKDYIENHTYHKTINNSDSAEICTPYRAFKDNKIISEEEYDPNNNRWFLATAYPTKDENTSEHIAIVLLEEITERKSVLEKYLSQLDMLDNVEDAIYTTDFNNRILFWNKGAEKIYGRKSNEVIDKIINKDFNLFPEPDTEVILQMTKELEVYRTYYFLREEYKADGSVMWVEGNVSLLSDITDTPLGLIYISRDITTRRNSEKLNHLNARLQRDLREISSLLLSGAELHTLEKEILSRCVNLTESNIGILANVSDEVVDISSSYSHLEQSDKLDVTTHLQKIYEWITLNSSSFISDKEDDKEISLAIKRILKSKDIIVSPITVKKEIIGLILIASSKFEFFKNTIDALNSFISIYLFVLNHFDRKRFQETLEDKLRQTQKFETATALLSGVVHDFNNILTGIRGAIGLLKHKTIDEKNIEYINSIDSLLDRGTTLSKNLLNVGKPTPPEKSVFTAEKIIEEVTHFIKQILPARIQLEVSLSENLPKLEADYSQLHQVLVNIVLNSRDAISDTGKISINADIKSFSQNDYNQNANIKVGRFLGISISDSGSGITKEHLKKIFDPYFTTKDSSKGTGLGLFVAYNIINSHGGFVIVESELNEGTTFNIYLPYKASSLEASAVKNSRNATHSGTILLADDENTIRTLLSEMLRLQGYKVLEASSGAEAIHLFLAEQEKIDLAILDYHLDDMNGFDVLQSIGEVNKLFPIFIATGVTEENIIVNLKSIGVTRIIEKPYEFENLLDLIDATLTGE
ncbi:MAG: PAS domain S-box protein [Ignavibacteria bacterium]|nr:PAS domain S-box protein [Ignavibacteria bacterium]